MSDALEKKHEILQRKYKTLRSNHRRLAGVALRLAEALEAFVRDDEKPDVNGILLSCSTIYPGLMGATDETLINEAVPEVQNSTVLEDVEEEKKEEEIENGKNKQETADDYYEGFWSRPKIPRTPQISSD